MPLSSCYPDARGCQPTSLSPLRAAPPQAHGHCPRPSSPRHRGEGAAALGLSRSPLSLLPGPFPAPSSPVFLLLTHFRMFSLDLMGHRATLSPLGTASLCSSPGVTLRRSQRRGWLFPSFSDRAALQSVETPQHLRLGPAPSAIISVF